MNSLLRFLSLSVLGALFLLIPLAEAQAQLSIAKSTISFGNVAAFDSKVDSFYVKNSTQFGFGVNNITATTSRYTVSPTSAIILPNDSALFRVTFIPDSIGTKADTLTITHTSSTQAPLKVALTGSGVDNLTFRSATGTNPIITTLSFRDDLATEEVLDSLLIQNATKSSITINAFTPSSKFTVKTAVPLTIAAGASEKIIVAYKATTVARDAGTLSVGRTPSPKGTLPTLAFSARGLANLRFALYSGRAVSIVDTNIVRPNVRQGTGASPRWQFGSLQPPTPIDSARTVGVHLFNRGDGSIQVDSIRTKGPDLTTTLPPYEHRAGSAYDRALQFTYNPTDLSNPLHRDTIMVFTKDTIPGANPLKIAFEGTSTRAVYVRDASTETSLVFGSVGLGSSANGTMRFFNYWGAPIVIDSLRFVAHDSKYQITTTSTNLTVARAEIALVNIRFTANDTLPSLSSTHPDTVLVYSSGTIGSTPLTFPVSASVVLSIAFNPSATSINFGDVTVNQPKDSLIKVYNRTGVAYRIDSVALRKYDHFTVLSNVLTTQLPANDSTSIQIRFRPLAAGLQRDTVLVYHNFPSNLVSTNPYRIALVGTGATQQLINPSNYVTVDNVEGIDGFSIASPDSSYKETGPFWTNTTSTSFGTGHRRSPNLAGSPAGSAATWTFRLDSTGNYLIYHYVLNSPNVGSGYFVHFRKFGITGILDSLRYSMLDNIATGFGGTWLPLAMHRFDGVGPNASSVTIGADAQSGSFMRVDAVRMLRSQQKADLEFGRRTINFDPERVPEEFQPITLGDEFVRPYRLFNLGSDTLVITNIRFFPTTTPVPWFFVKGWTPGTTIKIPPMKVTGTTESGGTYDLQLAFAPFEEGLARDSMVITSNDQNEPNAYIILNGEGVNYNFIMNASVGNTEPHFRAPSPPGVPTIPTYFESAAGSWLSSTASNFPYPITGANLRSRVNIGNFDAGPHQAFYRFELPELVGKIATDGKYLLEFSGPITSNAATAAIVKVTNLFGVPPDSVVNFNQNRASSAPVFAQIGGSIKTFFLSPGGATTVEFRRENGVGSGFLRVDLLRVRKVPTGALIGVPLAVGQVLDFGDVNFRSPAGIDGKANKKDLAVGSRGESQLVVNSYRLRDGRYFRLVNPPSTPVYLRAVSGEQAFTIEFLPNRIATDFRDTLEIRSNSTRDSLLLIPMVGVGVGGSYFVDDDGTTAEVASTPAFSGLYIGGWDKTKMTNWQLQTTNTADSIGRGKTRRVLPIYFNPNARFEWFPLIPTDPTAGTDSILVQVSVMINRGLQNASPRARYKVFSTGGKLSKDTTINQNNPALGTASRLVELDLGTHWFLRGGRDVPGGQAFHGHIRLENDTTAVTAFYGTGTNLAKRDTFALVADAIVLRELNAVQPRVVSVDNSGSVPLEFSLSQNFPNPFNPTTTINFTLPQRVGVDLRIYDILGREVATLLHGDELIAGYHSVRWDGRNNFGQTVATGIYFYRILAGGYVETKKMVLVK